MRGSFYELFFGNYSTHDKLVKSLLRATLSISGARNAHGANKTDFLRKHHTENVSLTLNVTCHGSPWCSQKWGGKDLASKRYV